MADLITKKAFGAIVEEVSDAFRLCPEDGYICEKCYKIVSRPAVMAQQGQFRELYCWCDFESPAYNYES